MNQHESERVAAVVLIALFALCHVGGTDARGQTGTGKGARARTESRRARPAQENEQARALVEEGLRRAEEGAWAEAFRAYKQALGISPRYADAHVAMGDAYMSTGNYAEAFKAYRQAVGFAPWSADAHYSLGAAYNDMAQYGEAFKPFVQAIRLDPEFAEAHYGIGYAYLKLENYRDALPYLRQAVLLRPDYAEAHLALGQASLALRDLRAAEAALKTLTALDAAAARDFEKQLRGEAGAANSPPRPGREGRSGTAAQAPREGQAAPGGAREGEADPKARLVATYKPDKLANALPAPPRKAAPNPPGRAPAASDASQLAVELSFWESIKSSNDPEEFAAYLRKYPEGQFAELARIRMRGLEGRKGEVPNSEVGAERPAPGEAGRQPTDEPATAAPRQPAVEAAPRPSNEQPPEGQPAVERPAEETPAPKEPGGAAGAATVGEALDLVRRLLASRFSYKATTGGETAGGAPATAEVNVHYEPLKFEGCTVEWRDQGDALWVSLSDLDPEAVRAEPRSRPGTTFSPEVWNVSISAVGGKGAINEAKGDGSGTVNRYNGLDLQYDSREKAESLAEALRRAIRLCGGGP